MPKGQHDSPRGPKVKYAAGRISLRLPEDQRQEIDDWRGDRPMSDAVRELIGEGLKVVKSRDIEDMIDYGMVDDD